MEYFLEIILVIKIQMFLYTQILLSGLETCITITTGSNADNPGNLKVEVNNAVEADEKFGKQEVVIDSCYKDLNDLKLKNPTTDAWAGKIEITVGGESMMIRCQGCAGSSSLKKGSIVVDGNSDSKEQSDTQCFNGDYCILTWGTLTSFIPIFNIFYAIEL